jgi:hypothetical protein
MSKRNGKGLLFCYVTVSTLVSQIPIALGGTVTAVAPGPSASLNLGLGATLDLLAFSEENGIQNEITRNSLLGVGRPASGAAGTISTANLGRYEPLVGFRNLDKPPGNAFIRSDTGNANATAEFNRQGDNVTILASAKLRDRGLLGGRAAAQASDPSVLAPGNYNYSYSINTLELETNAENELGGASFFATDSRFNDPLWILTIVNQGIVVTQNNLIINFVSNPILGLNDNTIKNQVQNAFNVSQGFATLNSFQLFNTTYFVDQEITFEESLNASIEASPENVSVPEPFSILSLVTFSILASRVTKRRIFLT